MKNKILHALSNRPGPFQTPVFSQTPSFVPEEIEHDQAIFRKKLFLDLTATDYYLKAYLALLHAFPDLERICEDTVVTYTIMDFPPRGVTIDGAEFLSTPNVVGQFTDPVPTDLPIDQTYELRYVSPGYLDIFARETGLVRRTSYHLTGDAPNQVMRLDWQDFPFDGPLKLSQTWEFNSRILIVVEPSRFPYEVLWQRIQGDLWLNQKVTNENLMSAMQSTMDVREKLAIALLVLILSNDMVFGAAPAPSIPSIEIVSPSVFPRVSPVTIVTQTPLPPATVGEFYSLFFEAIGGTGRYHWSVTTGTVPAGMTFSDNGHLFGTPLTAEFDDFKVTAVDY